MSECMCGTNAKYTVDSKVMAQSAGEVLGKVHAACLGNMSSGWIGVAMLLDAMLSSLTMLPAAL